MNYLLSDIAMTLAGKSTIPADQRDLSAGTVASVVITGIVVVFIALILLILLVSLYGKIFEKINNRNAAKAAALAEADKKEPAPAVTAAPAAPVIEDGIEEETVAVIMAAISAMSITSGKNLVLKSVKTAKPQRSAWSSAGVIENTRPF
ncbi:MAG: OadG family transporter subunit [Hominimerdicola sp.]